MSYPSITRQNPLRFQWILFSFVIGFIFILAQPANAAMGECADCHTMHNSQGSLPMRYDSGSTPLPQLLRGDCFGCHAQGAGALAIETIGVSRIPQVYHDDVVDLAGGNFGYIDGLTGSGASDAKGHNIPGLNGMAVDATLAFPPGGISEAGHNDGNVLSSAQLTCAGDPANEGRFGCHGNRWWAGPPTGITGAHHSNQSGTLDPGAGETRPGYSYRFLVGVKGYEDTDWQYTVSTTDHNEYYGLTNPIQLSCSATHCHGNGGVRPPDGTMSQYCATCHGNFHTLTVGAGDDTDGNSSGIGTGASPFIRHPTDLALPAGEYAGYTTYNLTAPVARTGAVPAGSTDSITNGSDAVMCLSCHVAHGSDYPDLLRFDYTTMDIGGGGPNDGCFACHTSKN